MLEQLQQFAGLERPDAAEVYQALGSFGMTDKEIEVSIERVTRSNTINGGHLLDGKRSPREAL